MLYVISLLITLTLAAPESSDRISIQDVFGPKDVSVIRHKDKLSLQKGAELQLGDEVQTVEKQVVQLQGYDGSQWKVAPSSNLKIQDRKAEQKNYSFWIFGLNKGSFWGKVTHAESKDGFKLKVKGKQASMGVRGTEYLMRSTGGEDELDVLEGLVLWGLSQNFEPGSYVEVPAGQGSIIKDGKIGKVSPTKEKGADLLKKYELASILSAEEQQSAVAPDGPTSRPQECLGKGLGWRSKDTSGVGDCFGH